MHLWEIEHPHYFFTSAERSFDSWQDFIDTFADADPDYNVVVRWDWWVPDDILTNDTLQICWVGPRQGQTWVSHVTVTRDDEPAIIEFLKEKAAYLYRLWDPILFPGPSA